MQDDEEAARAAVLAAAAAAAAAESSSSEAEDAEAAKARVVAAMAGMEKPAQVSGVFYRSVCALGGLSTQGQPRPALTLPCPDAARSRASRLKLTTPSFSSLPQ